MENPFLEKQIRNSVDIIRGYKFNQPFHLYLKEVFQKNKNWGSKDRKNYRKYCYLILKNIGTISEYLHIQSHPETFKESLKNQKTNIWEINNNLENHTNHSESLYPQNSSGNPENNPEERTVNIIAFIETTFQNVDNVVQWVLELLNGNLKWNAYEFQNTFYQNELLELPILSNGISPDIMNSWFHTEAPVFFLDKFDGLSNQFNSNQSINHLVSEGKGIIQDLSSTLCIAQLIDCIENQTISYPNKKVTHFETPNSKFHSESLSNINQKSREDTEKINPKKILNDYPVNTFINSQTDKLSLKNRIDKYHILQNKEIKIWDCCSGAGGKSLAFQLLYRTRDIKTETKNTINSVLNEHWICSDVRLNILENLKNRFQLLGLVHPKIQSINLLDPQEQNIEPSILEANLVLADLPCSGSGTWRRTPEERLKPFSITSFADKQLKIIDNILTIKRLNKEPYYVYYLTCSVFKQENEGNIQRILDNNSRIECYWSGFFGGYSLNADYIFGALLKVNPA